MDDDKKQLVINEKFSHMVDGIIVVRKSPGGAGRTKAVFYLFAVLFFAVVMVTAALLGVLKRDTTLPDTEFDGMEYEINFDSVTEHITDDPANRITQYHVIGPDHEVWALHDFDVGVHVLKVTVGGGSTRCYVTSLDAVTDGDYGSSPVITDITVSDLSLSSPETSVNVQEEAVAFEADKYPMTDVTTIGTTGQQLCQGHAIFQMWRYEMTASSSELDPNLPVLRTYTIYHRNTTTSSRQLPLYQSPVATIDSDSGSAVSRVRRQEIFEDDPEITTSLIEDQDEPSSMESKMFRIWDYFVRRRPRTRRELPVNNVEITKDGALREREDLLVRSRRHADNLPSAMSDQHTNEDLQTRDAASVNYRLIERYRRRRQRRSSSAAGVSNRQWPRHEDRQWPQQEEDVPFDSQNQGQSDRAYRAFSMYRQRG